MARKFLAPAPFSLSRRQFLRGAAGLGAAALGMGAAGGLSGCKGGESPDELNIFIWTEYVPDSVLEGFEEEYGIKINQYLFSSNEDMLAKVRTENEGTYDLLQPTDYMVKSLIEQDALQPLDKDALTNIGNIGDQYMDRSFDPGNTYSIPFMGSCTAIAYNQAEVETPPTSWEDLLDPIYENNVVSVNDFREVLGIAGYTIGLTGNETDDESIAKIGEKVQAFKPQIKVYDSDSPRTALVDGDCIAGMIFTAEIALAQRENPDIQVVYPTEGCSVGIDCWCVPKGAKHFDNAMLFLNYMLRPEVACVVSEDYPYVQPNTAAIELLDEEFINNPAENVPSDVFEDGHPTETLPPKVLRKYDKLWTNLKS